MGAYLLQHGLDNSAERFPAQEGMRFNGRSLTYATLAARSNQLAHFLRDQGVRRHDRVGIFLDKSLETPLAVYGILKAGAAYVPIDPKSPLSRLQNIVADCQLRLIITQSNKAGLLSELVEQPSSLEVALGLPDGDIPGLRTYSWEAVEAFPAERPPVVRGTEMDLAYIMYTSGSTGQPKGIMHTHHSGLSYAKLSAAEYDVTHNDRLGNHAPLHFDQSTFEFLTGPYCGATTVIIPEMYLLFPAELSQLIEDERLTIWYSVPFTLIQLLLRGVLDERDCSALRWVKYGGEPFPLDSLKGLMEQWPQARFSNVYGPSEVNQCTAYHIPPASEWPDPFDDVPLGTIWDNTAGLILDASDQPAERGELVIASATMMQGYWKRPELNARAFYRQPLGGGHVVRYYRTGDLVERRADGLLYFLGRKDNQIKVRGFRVELEEIDAVLASHTAVEQACAFVVTSDLGETIGASVIRQSEAGVSAVELIAYVRERLAPYMVPAQIEFVASLPRTGTGKIDRNAVQRAAQSSG